MLSRICDVPHSTGGYHSCFEPPCAGNEGSTRGPYFGAAGRRATGYALSPRTMAAAALMHPYGHACCSHGCHALKALLRRVPVRVVCLLLKAGVLRALHEARLHGCVHGPPVSPGLICVEEATARVCRVSETNHDRVHQVNTFVCVAPAQARCSGGGGGDGEGQGGVWPRNQQTPENLARIGHSCSCFVSGGARLCRFVRVWVCLSVCLSICRRSNAAHDTRGAPSLRSSFSVRPPIATRYCRHTTPPVHTTYTLTQLQHRAHIPQHSNRNAGARRQVIDRLLLQHAACCAWHQQQAVDYCALESWGPQG